jgi:antitoxin HigA-1
MNGLRQALLIPAARTISEAAEALDITRVNLSRVLNGHAALSIPLALRIEAAFGLSARALLLLQLDQDLARYRERQAPMRP